MIWIAILWICRCFFDVIEILTQCECTRKAGKSSNDRYEITASNYIHVFLGVWLCVNLLAYPTLSSQDTSAYGLSLHRCRNEFLSRSFEDIKLIVFNSWRTKTSNSQLFIVNPFIVCMSQQPQKKQNIKNT